MALKTQIEEDLKAAMLARESEKVTTLRGLKSAILDEEVKEGKREDGLSNEEIEKIVAKEVKKRKEAIEFYEADGRGDLVESESAEIEVLQKYLPKQMSEEEIKEKIDEVLNSISDGEVVQLGVVIGKVKMLVGNAADGALVAKLVKERIGK